ncbi:MAG: hypothetical protein LBB43_05230, partial [Spirochaetaceae bacterium]|nr:hypothetical protein [Spirochaetaceae bacterium]
MIFFISHTSIKLESLGIIGSFGCLEARLVNPYPFTAPMVSPSIKQFCTKGEAGTVQLVAAPVKKYAGGADMNLRTVCACAYPFTAPMVKPFTKQFCTKGEAGTVQLAAAPVKKYAG